MLPLFCITLKLQIVEVANSEKRLNWFSCTNYKYI